MLSFTDESSISLIHPDILAKFPNIEEVELGYRIDASRLNNPDKIENCQNVKAMSLWSKDFSGISRITFADCKKLETLNIVSDSLTELPDGLFENLKNLKTLTLVGKNLKLRVSPFEGLTSLSELELESVDLSQIGGNFFYSLNIKKLYYDGNDKCTFPIESLNSQEIIEQLTIKNTDLSEIPENFGPTLRSMKQLKVLNLRFNSIRSVEAFVDLPNVKMIDLSYNKIVKLPANAFKGCPRLTKLNLFANEIKALRGDEFNQLSELKELALTPTKLSNITPTTFYQLRALEKLLVFIYPITNNNVIGKELFSYSTNLKSLRLNGNNIQAIHPESFNNLHKLTFLDLSGNNCVSEKFEAPEGKVLDMALIKEKLKKCFANCAKKKIAGG